MAELRAKLFSPVRDTNFFSNTERVSRGRDLASVPSSAGAGLPAISWHRFRHNHATLLSDLGESLKTAQAQLGHARLSTTAEIYTHVVPPSQRAAIEKLERAIWPQMDPSYKR